MFLSVWVTRPQEQVTLNRYWLRRSAERALNHTIKGMEANYNQYQFLRERKEALDKWADFLERCANGQHYNVIQGQFSKAVS